MASTRAAAGAVATEQEVARVRGEYFRDIRPVDTVMQVSRFIDPDWLVEIEVDAIIADR